MSTPIQREEWRPVVGWEGLYEVSSLGHIRNVKRNRVRKLFINKDGYMQVTLSKKWEGTLHRVHQLVLKAFVGPIPFQGAVGRHLNGIRDDNRVANLTWGTVLENAADAKRHGTTAKGLKNGGWNQAKLMDEDVRRIRESILFGALQKDLMQIYGVSRSTIYNVTHRSWAHI